MAAGFQEEGTRRKEIQVIIREAYLSAASRKILNRYRNKLGNLSRNLQLPVTVSPDENVNRDLAGKILAWLQPQTICLLAYDLPLFSDEAFRFYIFHFIDLVVSGNCPFSKTAFIQDLFPSERLQHNTRRFLQFSTEEASMISEYLHTVLEVAKMDGPESELGGFLDWENEIVQAIHF